MTMHYFSIGGRLVIQQLLFVVLFASVASIAFLAVRDMHDTAAMFMRADADHMRALISGVLEAADHVTAVMFWGLIAASAFIVFISLPVTHITISEPIRRLAHNSEASTATTTATTSSAASRATSRRSASPASRRTA